MARITKFCPKIMRHFYDLNDNLIENFQVNFQVNHTLNPSLRNFTNEKLEIEKSKFTIIIQGFPG